MPNRWLQGPATRADVVAWAITVPVVMWSIVQVPLVRLAISAREESLRGMAIQGHRPIPSLVEQLVLGAGADGLTVIQAAIVAVPAIALFRTRRAWLKIALPMTAAAGLIVVFQLVMTALEPGFREL